MKISYLTDEALYTLRAQLPDNVACYASGDLDFFYDFLEKKNGLRTERRFDFPNFELDMTSDYAVSDSRNVRTLYGAMRELPPSVASDERLWSGLAHGLFWDYVQYRQAEKIATKDPRKIAPAFFFTNGHKRSLYVNCLSRLWWAGYLTYDEDNEQDPFALTDLVTKNAFASTVMLLSSSNMTANHEICLGVLDSIQKRQRNGERIERKHFVASLRYLNNMGAITLLDVLSRSEITAIVDEYLSTDSFARLKLGQDTAIDVEQELAPEQKQGSTPTYIPASFDAEPTKSSSEKKSLTRSGAVSIASGLLASNAPSGQNWPNNREDGNRHQEENGGSSVSPTENTLGATAVSADESESPQFSKSQLKVISAADYYVDYSGYSFETLVAQLVDIGFSEEEAIFGAEHSKADWMQEAVETADQWIEFMQLSKDELRKQLKDDGFTPEQIEYGLAHCNAEWNKV